MTRNQIEYFKILESRRSNLVNEYLTSARDTAAKEARVVELSESKRHNQATEAQARADLYAKVETNRINLLNAETNARNADTNYENALSNRMQATASQVGAQAALSSAGAAYTSAQAALTNAETGVFRAQEEQRHNTITEQEQQRHNVANERNELYDYGTKRMKTLSDINLNAAKVDLTNAQIETEPFKRRQLSAQEWKDTAQAKVAQEEAKVVQLKARSGAISSLGNFASGASSAYARL